MYDMKAPKQTVSLTVNSDLYARAKKLGINASQIAEEALTQALARKLAEQIRAEIREDLAAYNSYIEAQDPRPRWHAPTIAAATMQFDVHRNPVPQGRRAYPCEAIIAALDYLFGGV